MGIEAVKNNVTSVVAILNENGFHDISEQLNNLFKNLDNPVMSENALKEIIGLCHIRAMGDLNIKTIDCKNWLKTIGKLHSKTKAALNKLSDNKL